MHNIRRKILDRLFYERSLGYAQLRPAGIESNHFAYHLDQLIREGLIAKADRAYTLTTKGLALADKMSHDNLAVRVQPHIVTSIHIVNEAGQYLLYKHAFQPYIDKYGPPQGRLHYAETIMQAATRELAEKTGLKGVPLRHRGMAYVKASRGDEVISKILIHVFTGVVKGTPPLCEPTKKGSCSWGVASKLKAAECMPGFRKIQKLLEIHGDELFFVEISEELQ